MTYTAASQPTPRRGWLLFLGLAVIVIVGGQLGGWTTLVPAWLITHTVTPVVATVAVWRHHGGWRSPWWMHAAGLVFGPVAALAWTAVLVGVLPQPPNPLVYDSLIMLGYTMSCLGVFRMVRIPRGRVAWAAELDSAIVAVGIAVPLWIFMLGPALRHGQLAGQPVRTLLFYSVVDVLLISGVVRLLFTDGRRTPSHLLMISAVSALLVADTTRWVYVAADGSEPAQVGAALTQVWMMLSVTSMLHPSAPRTGGLVLATTDRRSRLRLFIFLALTVAGPLAALADRITAGESSHHLTDAVVAAVLTATLGVLLVLRMQLVAGVARARSELLAEALLEQERLQAELRQLALHDSLTGLGNRAMLADRLPDALAGPSPALLLFDLDGFKNVNDTLGHPAGDELLVQVAARLIDAMPGADMIVRLGGDEFAVAFADASPHEVAQAGAAAVAAIGTPFMLSGEQVRIGTSVGAIAGYRPGSSSDALRNADLALYAAKAAGKNRVVLYDAPQQREAVGAFSG